MSQVPLPSTDKPRIVVIGGGFAGIKLVKRLKNLPVQVVLFDRNNYHTFQPLLYQVATAGLEPDSIADPLRKQLEPVKNFFFRMAEVYSIEPENNLIKTEIGEVKYDYLVLATGSKTNFFGNESIMQNGFPLKQIPQALDLRSHILQNFEAANIATDEKELASRMNVVIVGGGPTGVEVAGAMGELKNNILPGDYPELDFGLMTITLLEGDDRLLRGMSEASGKRALKYLEKFGVKVRLNTMVKSYDGLVADLGDGGHISTHTLIWAAGVKGNFPKGLNKESIDKGRLLVDPYNAVKGHDNVFAIGDIAMMSSDEFPQGHPMLAPVAIQQGEHLAQNFKHILSGKQKKAFKYKDQGSMATVGRNKAVADIGNMKVGGFMAWLIWMFIHLISIIGFRNKIIVFSNWVWNYFTYDKGTRLIIRKFIPKNRIKEEV
ncbi:NAD(P)/FAD-dependent oxidoreductase [Fulvivirga sp. RKSG066]|uniref:NAD(P)/FAD-dependent oxidoreductase n=1 Tax=Fulvivirga aurantia TaxID=2529383 RepID=UPI0012BCB695|nr:NAD(P)/FAD-dependent oxidoreductase [Fulvivirga aurantia]MTI21258.1 NAD(P)/FAD-dependent oxidoreductase [Fulvivirga aurantia]